MAFAALASLEKVVYSLRHHLVQGPESEILCLLGTNPQQSDDLTIQIAAQLLYQILNLDIVY